MLQGIKFTLYEVFGYFLPGLLFLSAWAVLAWACFWSTSPLNIAAAISFSNTWLFMAVSAYVLGHICQAVGNLIGKRWVNVEDKLLASAGEHDSLVNAAIHRVGVDYGIDAKDLGPKWLYAIFDQAVVASGHVEDRDIYIYREGFYRGSAVALFALGVAILIRWRVPEASLVFCGTEVALPPGFTFVLGLLVIGASALTFTRWIRFGKYRVSHSLVVFLAERNLGSELPPHQDRSDEMEGGGSG